MLLCVAQSTIWFANHSELDLFHAVVTDLKARKHPGNRISVPLIRQATITKRNRAGFFIFKHAVRRRCCVPSSRRMRTPKARRMRTPDTIHVADFAPLMQTLMPHKMVITRAKGSAPPEDVITLRDASVSLDEKKGHVTIGVTGKTSVWRGLTTEDTFKWHDALLSAISQCAPPVPTCVHTRTRSSQTPVTRASVRPVSAHRCAGRWRRRRRGSGGRRRRA